jgi:hypothetical protein
MALELESSLVAPLSAAEMREFVRMIGKLQSHVARLPASVDPAN